MLTEPWETDPECPHGNSPRSDCVVCDPRAHLVLACVKCAPGQTWHALEGESTWVCRKCGTQRGGPAKDDISIAAPGVVPSTVVVSPDRLPEIPGLRLTVTEVREPSRKLGVALAPEVTRCGIVATMTGPRKIHECDQQFDGSCMEPPPGWALKTTGPDNKGYFYAVCERHA